MAKKSTLIWKLGRDLKMSEPSIRNSEGLKTPVNWRLNVDHILGYLGNPERPHELFKYSFVILWEGLKYGARNRQLKSRKQPTGIPE